MQGFIGLHGGIEHVQLIEVVEEVPLNHAVVRYIGTGDATARTSYRLTSTTLGTTLEYEHTFTVPGVQSKLTPSLRSEHYHAADTFLSRAKYILEQDFSPRQGRHC